MRIRILLAMIFGGFYLTVWGGKGIRDAVLFRHPQTMTCEQFTKSPPSEGLFKVTGCEMALNDAVFVTKKSKYGQDSMIDDIEGIKEMYIPVYPKLREKPEEKSSDPVALVLKTHDPQIIANFKDVYSHAQSRQDLFQQWKRDHLDKLILKRDIFGLVQSGMDVDDKVQYKISSLHSGLVSDIAIIEEGKTPSFLFAYAKFSLGLALFPLAWLFGRGTFRGFRRRRR